MTAIVCASSKGGCGKTTIVTLLAGEFARRGKDENMDVTIVDADPNRHSSSWASKDGCPSNISVVCDTSEIKLGRTIDNASKESDFVLVDLEGAKSMAFSNAIGRASLVIIPCQGSYDDAVEATRTIELIHSLEELLQRKIPFSLLFTRTNAITNSLGLREIIADFKEEGYDMFKASLIDREAFKSVRMYGGIVNDLKPKQVSGAKKAAENVRVLVNEVVEKLTSQEA